MKRIQIAGLCLGAALALSAVAAPMASAEPPEYGRCVAKAGGKFSDANCKTKAVVGKEKFEWTSTIINPKFTNKLKEGTPTLETANLTKTTCVTAEAPGEITSPKSIGHVVVHFTGCKTSGLACQNEGKGAGEIETSPLGGPIGIEKLGETHLKDKIAQELHAESGNVAEFLCAGLTVVVKGSVLHTLTTNKSALTYTEKFAQKAGEQKPEHLAGGVKDEHTLEASTAGAPFEEAALAFLSTTTYGEKIELSTIN
jgi:hypothetical protein